MQKSLVMSTPFPQPCRKKGTPPFAKNFTLRHHFIHGPKNRWERAGSWGNYTPVSDGHLDFLEGGTGHGIHRLKVGVPDLFASQSFPKHGDETEVEVVLATNRVA